MPSYTVPNTYIRDILSIRYMTLNHQYLIEQLFVQVEQFGLVSHLHLCLPWCIADISSSMSGVKCVFSELFLNNQSLINNKQNAIFSYYQIRSSEVVAVTDEFLCLSCSIIVLAIFFLFAPQVLFLCQSALRLLHMIPHMNLKLEVLFLKTE